MVSNAVLEVIRRRRSVRSFREEPLPPGVLEQLLEAACWAPSAGNLQPWQFYVVRSPEKKKQVAAAARQGFLAGAPAIVVVCALPERSAAIYGDRGRYLYCLQDTAAAVQNLLLAATSLGLATCWIGAFDEGRVRQVLGLSAEARPVALVPVGYAAGEPPTSDRRPLEAVVRWLD